MKLFDVIIIGGGVTGAAMARELSRYKLKIALLEKEVELAFGISKSNSGIIHPGTQNPSLSLKGRLCAQGNQLMRGLAQELGVDFKEVGELIVIFQEEEKARLRSIAQEAEALGVPGLQMVDRPWLRQHEPNLSPDIVAALYAPTAGIISPYRLVYDLAENAMKNGVEIYTAHKVTGIIRPADYFEIQSTGGIFRSRYLINAAGLWGDEIANLVGIQDIVIKPRKGEEYLLDKKLENLTNHLVFPLPTPTSKGIIVIKTSDGNPMIGPTAQDGEDKEDLATTDQGLNQVLASAQKLVPAINRDDIIAYFAGLRAVAGDDFIIRHENQCPGLINVVGIQSPGLTCAPAIALMVIEILRQHGLSLQKKRRFYKNRKPFTHLFALPLGKANKVIQKNAAYGDIVCRCEMISAQEIREAIKRGATTLDGIKFRTRAQAGRCHGGFCTTRIMKIMAEELNLPCSEITKRGPGSEIIKASRENEANDIT
jgi:glycerol-3-phosphate dehydrogenase